jgi:hypothetical protein
MHPINNLLPRLFPVLLVLGAAVLIAQLVGDDDSEDSEGGGGDRSEGGEGSEGGTETAGPEEGFQPA